MVWNRTSIGIARMHSMPFGSQIEEGAVRFRLWAPDARQVTLCLEENGDIRTVIMERQEEGWYQCLDARAAAGSQYRFQIDGGVRVPDPASRFQPDGVHGPSMVVDPLTWQWRDAEWRGRPLEEAVFYELHVGTFSSSGTFGGVADQLDYLAGLGVTAIELMPVAAFAGCRNWGYDGVLPFAPTACYGKPEDLKALVEAAHRRHLMVFLDVVYNHFGPEGNYLHRYAPYFFTDRLHTPWGEAIRFNGQHCRHVRRFFVENALYWLEEYHFDGLRFDAVHAIFDPSKPDILEELANAVREGPGKIRRVHLILENDGNEARYLARGRNGRPIFYSAQWNDDVHHALHVLLTGETDGYYRDYAAAPAGYLGRALAEGFAYQGEISIWRGGSKRGTPSGSLPPAAFVNFLQNHDQIGNRAFGERLTIMVREGALKTASAILLLSPQIPLLFMGQEWGCRLPFLYFCDFGDDLAPKVREGRRREFGRFASFADRELLKSMPDPCVAETFSKCVLDWDSLAEERQREWLTLHRRLLEIRQSRIVPLLGKGPVKGKYGLPAERVLRVEWRMAEAAVLVLAANFDDHPFQLTLPAGEPLYFSEGVAAETMLELPPWSAAFFMENNSQVRH